jgi:hypothetical protein
MRKILGPMLKSDTHCSVLALNWRNTGDSAAQFRGCSRLILHV